MRKLAAGNWKMNGTRADLAQIEALEIPQSVDVLICPPATLIAAAVGLGPMIGAQDCHAAPQGAHTGDLSAPMLRDAGAEYVILGHSERRADHGERDGDVLAKVAAARAAGLCPIVCVGESLAQRQSGDAIDVVTQQMAASLPEGCAADVVVAYEPIWAIGTGQTASGADIAAMHGALRAALVARFGAATGEAMRLLYGGSVKPGNAAEIFATANVDGALVGGASLKAEDFGAIIAALAAA